jgi:hypothetical protein
LHQFTNQLFFDLNYSNLKRNYVKCLENLSVTYFQFSIRPLKLTLLKIGNQCKVFFQKILIFVDILIFDRTKM